MTLALGGLSAGLCAAERDSLAGLVPADVGLFVEARNADDLLIPLTDEQVWVTLAELAGQPARPEDARRWRERIHQTVKMDPNIAIQVLFSQRVAFVGQGPGRAQDAVVLCRPSAAIPIDGLLRLWEAEPWPQSALPGVYRLPGSIGLAVRDRTLLFGDGVPRSGMFRRVVKFNTPAPAGGLADDPTYRRLLARVPPDPDGVLFARLSQAGPLPYPATMPATQPGALEAPRRALPELPGPLRGSANVLFSMHRRDSRLHFTAVGDAPLESRRGGADLRPLVEHLPERTLLAWAGHIDYPGLIAAVEKLPPQNALRIAVKLPQQPELVAQLVAALDSGTCFALGWVRPAARAADAPPLPALAALLSTRQPQVAGERLAALVQSWVTVYGFLSLTQGLPPLPPRRRLALGQSSAYVQDLSNLLPATGRGAIGELQLCWAADGQVLVVASHSGWLRQILAARHGQAADLSPLLRLTQRPVASGGDTIIVAQSGPISDLGARWLGYLRQRVPQVFEERWWRARQPGGAKQRIGIVVDADPQRRRLRVRSVQRNLPAAGVLRVGDTIVGANGKRFATTQPIREIRKALEQRPNARWFELLVEREGVLRPLRIPLPFVNPIDMLGRAVAIGKIAQRIVYFDDLPQQAGARGFLTIELRQSPRPLFDLAAGPATRPGRAGE